MIESLSPYFDVTKRMSIKYAVPPNLILAIIYQESRGRNWTYRYEPRCKYNFTPGYYARKHYITDDSEIMAQRTSWGLMQIMGFRARELGFDGILTQLCISSIGIEYGVKNLSGLLIKYEKEDEIIASYNSGSPVYKIKGELMNRDYVDSVKGWIRDLSGIHLM